MEKRLGILLKMGKMGLHHNLKLRIIIGTFLMKRFGCNIGVSIIKKLYNSTIMIFKCF